MHQTLHLYLVKITCLGCARYELRACSSSSRLSTLRLPTTVRFTPVHRRPPSWTLFPLL